MKLHDNWLGARIENILADGWPEYRTGRVGKVLKWSEMPPPSVGLHYIKTHGPYPNATEAWVLVRWEGCAAYPEGYDSWFHVNNARVSAWGEPCEVGYL